MVNQFRIKKAMERGVLLGLERDVDPSKLDEAAEVCVCVCVGGRGCGRFL